MEAMSHSLTIEFKSFTTKATGLVVLLAEADLSLGKETDKLLAKSDGLLAKAAAADGFTGAAASFLDLIAPAGVSAARLLVAGLGVGADLKELDFVKLGGAIVAKLPDAAKEAVVVLDLPSGPIGPQIAADIALGARLRFYDFQSYKVKKRTEASKKSRKLTFLVADPKVTEKAFASRLAVADGVDLARTLVNEPANVLNPAEFARRATELKELGVEVDVLGEKELAKIGMRALLGVGLGSHNETKVVIMRWNGGKAKEAPLAFIGKGVTFDTGGISIKPADKMEDMKGDMGGAAAVTGLMHALAARKAKVNVVGVIGLVENMPDGKAQRPGDIVTSLSGQTIEIINTDAEGRLVLADLLWYTKDEYKPVFMINLATLTGAILVALGTEHAGLFSNADDLSDKLTSAGLKTGEKVWRMPLSAEYDKLIDSTFADMKNTGGRLGGSITAAQFLQRYVETTPWAHLDIAGTAMSSPKNDLNRSWGSGWGVRLLDRLVADHYEA